MSRVSRSLTHSVYKQNNKLRAYITADALLKAKVMGESNT